MSRCKIHETPLIVQFGKCLPVKRIQYHQTARRSLGRCHSYEAEYYLWYTNYCEK